MKLYPLKFEPLFRRKVWGGRRIASLGHTLPETVTADIKADGGGAGAAGAADARNAGIDAGGDDCEQIGESWEIADIGGTADAGPMRTRVANGPLAGKTLCELIAEFGEQLMGRLEPTATGDFPLLVKYLDAQQNLSVQVHPSPAYAAAHPDAHLKSEAWYIVEADPGAVIYKGLHVGVTQADMRNAIERNDDQAVRDLMLAVPVKAGDCHYLPSGTCHALGAGILVAEVQIPSDTTFRVYDWGRTQRELHIEQALECMTYGPPNVAQFEKRSHVAGMFTTVSSLVKCEHFAIEKVRMTEAFEQELPYDQPAVWMVLKGSGRITRDGMEAVPFKRGETLLIPANMDDAKVCLDEDTVWLDVTFPRAMPKEVV